MLGFSEPPEGRLLKQVLELDFPMGLAYERSVAFEKKPHVHERSMLICPRGACRMSVGIFENSQIRPKEEFIIDSNHLLWIPEGVIHDDRGLSTIYDTFALYPDDQLFLEMLTDNALDQAHSKILHCTPIKIKRNTWLQGLLERYFFERILNELTPKDCTFFLEKQILNEFVRLAFLPQNPSPQQLPSDIEDDIADRALKYIETNLFEKISIRELSKIARTSESTLNRNFRAHFGMPPASYIKNRRLDEAMALLKRGAYSVQDICYLVGYEDLASFSKAFKQKFEKSPSEFRATKQ